MVGPERISVVNSDMTRRAEAIAEYVQKHVRTECTQDRTESVTQFTDRLEKAFALLPDEVLESFLRDARLLSVKIMRGRSLPLGMQTRPEGTHDARSYTVILYEEHLQWPDDVFIGAFLRELAHVIAERPPETEWPASRGERARFKERLECRADATVWKWGLKDYSVGYITAIYPKHWVDAILNQIDKMLLEEEGQT